MTPTADLITAGAQAVKHSIMRTVSVICVLAVIAGLWFAVDKAFIHPRPTESYAQKAKAITNIEHHNYYDSDSKFFFGLKLWGFKLGISRIEKRNDTKNPVSK